MFVRRLSLVVTIALLVGAFAASAAAVQAADAVYTPPPVNFGACTANNSGAAAATLQFFGAKCGYVTVPLNYANPNGKKIKLAISRVMHTTSAANYKGIM